MLTSIRLGEWDTSTDHDCDDAYDNEIICSDGHVDYGIEKTIIHPQYNPMSKQNDIALIRLSKDVKFTKFITPICLPSTMKHLNLTGLDLSVVGKEFSFQSLFTH